MRRALELASLGLGHVSPNPLVGCVVVHDGRIVGEGWHQKYGGSHAEVNAIRQVNDDDLLPDATVYVNLEPCSHFGKTPPCADLLVEKRVKRVVIANRDPNPKVAGQGIERLRAAGIDVSEGVLAREGRWLNRRFFTAMEQHIPYVMLKWAETADGFMASSARKPVWISNERSRQRVHQWRAEEDAVLVGAGTAEIDNPRLTVRDWSGRNPVRVVLDPKLRLPSSLHLFDGTQATLFYNWIKSDRKGNLEFIKIREEDFLHEVLVDLLLRGVGCVMVEGGPSTLQKFIETGLWHEVRVFRSEKLLKEGVPAPRITSQPFMTDTTTGDTLSIYLKEDHPKG
jgi:diaminohydroxyphosphoribosylaminopyrimidine deaminase/5-amino-6-(5-phosphoribosylamino)uracil reductase